MDRVKKKLAGWKANLLSMAGRMVLIQASTSAIPSYVMQSNSLPNKILNGIDRVNRNFLWGSSEHKRKMHWVNWEVVTKPKESGGLGLQSAKGRNTALLAKLNWRFHTEKDALWAKVLRFKYGSRQRLISRNEAKLPSSSTWKGLRKGMDVFKKGAKWVPGYESSLNFWSDCWLNSGPISASIHGPLPLDSVNLTLKDLRTPYGWNWAAIPFVFPPDIKVEIQAVAMPVTARSCDKLAWKFSAKGSFDMKSAYLLATDQMVAGSFLGSWIWKIQTLPKIQMFIWRCMHNSVGVNECLAKRGMALDILCPLCLEHPESISHALRDCRLVKPVWHQLGSHHLNTNFFSQDVNLWLASNACLKSSHTVKGIPWFSIFSFAIWALWKQRNQVVFNNKGVNPNISNVIFMQAMEFVYCVTQPRCRNRMIVRQIKWEKPDMGWVKLNTDGAADVAAGSAGGGGLIRDDQGNWIIGFTRKIGKTSSFLAETWALRDGLILCKQLKLNAVMVELDAKALIDALKNPSYANTIVSPLFDDCKQLASQIPHLSFKHIYREANRCADRLAYLGSCQGLDFNSFFCPLVDLVPLVLADCQGMVVNRLCPDLLFSP